MKYVPIEKAMAMIAGGLVEQRTGRQQLQNLPDQKLLRKSSDEGLSLRDLEWFDKISMLALLFKTSNYHSVRLYLPCFSY